MRWLTAVWLTVAPLLGCAPAEPAPTGRDAVSAMYERARERKFPEVADITPEEVLAAPERYLLVDVRPPEERAVSMLPGAIPAEAFDPAEVHGRTVVPYCTIGQRSGLWAREHASAGVEMRNLAGSVLAWTFAGGPLEGPDGPTRRVHTYGKRWGIVAEGYEATW